MKSIIFDIDGTLWDSTEVVAGAWNKAIIETGFAEPNITSDILKREFGKPMNIIADNLFPMADKSQKDELLELCCVLEHEALVENKADLAFPDVVATIKALSSKYPLYIVSNCQSGYIELVMDKLDISDYIIDHECYGNTGKSKGENLVLLMERNGLLDTVYVGDTQGDYEACVFSGIPFIFVEYGFGKPEGYDKAIKSIKALLAL